MTAPEIYGPAPMQTSHVRPALRLPFCCLWDLVSSKDLSGVFSYPRLVVVQEQVRVMTEKHHVYLTQDGRISMAGLSASKCRYLAEAINDAVRNA